MTRAKELLDAAPPDVQGCVTHHACNCASWRLAEWERLVNDRLPDYEAAVEALERLTSRRDCEHGHTDVIHVAPAHFDGGACPSCSNAEYADEIQRREPCDICAALARLRSEVPA